MVWWYYLKRLRYPRSFKSDGLPTLMYVCCFVCFLFCFFIVVVTSYGVFFFSRKLT